MGESNQTTPKQTGINPVNEANFRALRTFKGKMAQCDHHIELLSDHLIKGSALKGLTPTIEPNVPGQDTTLIVEWERKSWITNKTT